ncbi:hypothetical protein BH10ACT7_BH10ACT7_14930 [soil metagenome]
MKRSRIVAGALALGLIGASAIVLASPVYAVANVPDLINTGGSTTNTTPLIQGYYDNSTGDEIDINVEVSSGGPFTPYCVDSILAGETSPAEPWGCVGAALPYGDYTFRSYAFDTLNALQSAYSATTSFQIGGAEPIVIVTPPDLTNTSDATTTFSGTGPARGTVAVFDSSMGTLCTSPVDITGNWSCTSIPIETGVRTIWASGNTIDFVPQGPTPNQTLTLDPPPAPTVDPYPFAASGEGSPAVQGNMALDVGQILVYSSPDNVTWSLYCQVPTDPLATVWFCPTPFGTLPIGTNYIAATADTEYTAGVPSGFSASITIEVVPPPVLVSPADGVYTNDSTPTFSGTSVYGANFTVRLVAPSMAICGGAVVANAWSCTPAPLADGTYQWFTNIQPGNGITSALRTITIDTVAPGIPSITQPGMTTTSTRPVLRGNAEPGAYVQVYRNGALAGCQEGAVYANGSGVWQCTSSATLTVGSTYGFGAVQTDLAGNLSSLGVPPVTLSLTILAPPVTPAASPSPTPLPMLAWNFSFGVGATEFAPGDETELNATGLPPGASVDVEFHSTPVKVGSTIVGPDGSFSLSVQIPEDAEVGPHKFVVTATPLEGPPSVQEQAVTVRIPPKQAADSVHEQPFVAPPGATGEARNDPGAPSSLTNSLETAQSIFSNPAVIGGAAIAGLALLLLVAFPAELLNSTISEEYGRFAKRIPKVRAPWWQRFTNWLKTTPLFGSILLIFAAAIIFGFADPGFGFDITSLRVVLACAISIFIVGYISSAISGAIIRRRFGLATIMELKPLGLILTIIGVALSRVLDFSPGFLLGLIFGIAIVGNTTLAQRAKVTLVHAGVVFGFAITAWLVYSLLSATVAPDTFGTALAFDVLVAVTAEGLTALFIGLLPLRYLDGVDLFAYSKLLWAGLYTLAALAFVLIVVPSSWGELSGSLGLWLAMVGGFAVLAVGVYLYFRFWAPPHGDDEDETDEPAAVTSGNEPTPVR